MASGPLVGGGGDGSLDKRRWAESKVYTRKCHNKSSKASSVTPATPSLPAAGAVAAAGSCADDATLSQQPQSRFGPASDDSSSLNRPPDHPSSDNGFLLNRVRIDVSSRSKHEIRELRRKLTNELEEIRSLVKRMDSKGPQLNGPQLNGGDYSHSQLSANDAPNRRLTVSVVENSTSDVVEKEKRTPKANQFYRSSDFVLGKEKFPPPESSNKKLKPNGVQDKLMAQTLKHCMNLLMKLIKHGYGWVFDKPVDVKALGLHDYYTIIKHPMDLGTVKSRLENNWYKSPREFAEDVRLTFNNALTYNPKGHDVHVMAEQLLKIFEDRWVLIESEYCVKPRLELDYEAAPPAYSMKKAYIPPPPIEMRPALGRSEAATLPVVDSKPKVVTYTATGRVAAPKKPKAKDPHKRDMTYEEKQKLSSNLVNLPPEKLDNVVQIIKKRSSAVSQHDDEIEVDIDSFDVETLWELDRFVTNYKKSLSKNKRKAELAIQARGETKHNNGQGVNTVTVTAEASKENKTEDKTISLSQLQGEKPDDNASRSSTSSSSSSDSGSSSSDSDSESSSAGSDAGHSPRT